MKGRRYLVLHLPRLATDRIRQREPELAKAPISRTAMAATLGRNSVRCPTRRPRPAPPTCAPASAPRTCRSAMARTRRCSPSHAWGDALSNVSALQQAFAVLDPQPHARLDPRHQGTKHPHQRAEPRHTLTLGLKSMLPGGAEARIATTIPVGRLGTPADLGKAAVLLASDDGEYIHGVVLEVDGGVVQV